jgi:hypothetical protein
MAATQALVSVMEHELVGMRVIFAAFSENSERTSFWVSSGEVEDEFAIPNGILLMKVPFGICIKRGRRGVRIRLLMSSFLKILDVALVLFVQIDVDEAGMIALRSRNSSLDCTYRYGLRHGGLGDTVEGEFGSGVRRR